MAAYESGLRVGGGRWWHVVLADGNIGIGGSPIKLLRRAADHIHGNGSILAEVEGPGRGYQRFMVGVEAHGHRA